MKRKKFILAGTLILIFLGCRHVLLNYMIIKNTVAEECVIQSDIVITINEGSSYDIVFQCQSGASFYINRGIEQGLKIEALKKKVIGKEVKLHLPKTIMGVSSHISQLAVEDVILFSEFAD